MQVKKVVLAYSGGLDTSVALKWIQEEYNAEVITYTADLGQGRELDSIEQRAKDTGAIKAYIEDLREEFVKGYVFPALKAGAIYESRYMLATALGRPLIGKRMVEIAQKEGVSINQFIASAVAEKVSAIATEEYLLARAQRADKAAFELILAKVAKYKTAH